MRWFAIFLGALLFMGCGKTPQLANGAAAPDFQLPDLAGKPVGLDGLKGEVVAVRFWADWCRFCEGEMRALQPVYARLHGAGFEMLAVNVGQSRATAEAFTSKLGISYPVLLDSDSKVTERYGVIALPTTVLIDRQGRVRGKILGESDPAAFERAVAPLLAEAHEPQKSN